MGYNKIMFIHNDPKLKPRRQELRKNQTPHEDVLWAKLKLNQLGFKFRRQHSIGGYVVDFYCPEKKLVIEIDGSQHIENKEYDNQRTIYLNALNIKVLRFWNNEINDSIDSVINKIIKELDSCSPSP
jgi:very-short-patch-repair endonuclease